MKLQHLQIGAIVVLVLLTGCSNSTAPKTTAATVSPTLVTYTPLPSPLQATRTPTPSSARTQEIVTPTVGPTLTADQEEALVLGMLQNNGGCRLPCWWGFMPGQTDWQIVQGFLASTGKAFTGYGDPYVTYEVSFKIPKHEITIDQAYVVRDEIIDTIWVSMSMVRNNEAVFGDPLFADDLQPYMLPRFLEFYGQPDKVLVKTFSSAPEGGWVPFRLMLFYPRQGVLVIYQGPNERVDQKIRWCPSKTNIALWLWSPERELALEDVAGMGPNLTAEELSTYLSIEEATSMDIEAFYESFKDTGAQACLETQVNLWP